MNTIRELISPKPVGQSTGRFHHVQVGDDDEDENRSAGKGPTIRAKLKAIHGLPGDGEAAGLGAPPAGPAWSGAGSPDSRNLGPRGVEGEGNG